MHDGTIPGTGRNGCRRWIPGGSFAGQWPPRAKGEGGAGGWADGCNGCECWQTACLQRGREGWAAGVRGGMGARRGAGCLANRFLAKGTCV